MERTANAALTASARISAAPSAVDAPKESNAIIQHHNAALAYIVLFVCILFYSLHHGFL